MIHYTTATTMCGVDKEGDNEWTVDEMHSHPLLLLLQLLLNPPHHNHGNDEGNKGQGQ